MLLPAESADIELIEVLRVTDQRDWHAWTTVPGEEFALWEGDAVRDALALIADLPDGVSYRCFVLGYGIRAHSADALLFEIAFCFRCHNAMVIGPAHTRKGLVTFDADSAAAQELLRRLRAADPSVALSRPEGMKKPGAAVAAPGFGSARVSGGLGRVLGGVLGDEGGAQDVVSGLQLPQVDRAVLHGVAVDGLEDVLDRLVVALEALLGVDGHAELQQQLGGVAVDVELVDGVLARVEFLLDDLEGPVDEGHGVLPESLWSKWSFRIPPGPAGRVAWHADETL
jgi:hypothetical protein